MKTTEINVPTMRSAHCQARVYNALKDLVQITKLEAGRVTVSIESDQQKTDVLRAIEEAGYTVENGNAEAGSCCSIDGDSCNMDHSNTSETENELRFKTNINCSGCVASVQPHLDNAEGICEWHVDTANKDKILTVKTEGITGQQVLNIIQKAGFKGEPLS